MWKPGTIQGTGYMKVTHLANAALISGEKSISSLMNHVLEAYSADAAMYSDGDEADAIEDLRRMGMFTEKKLDQVAKMLD